MGVSGISGAGAAGGAAGLGALAGAGGVASAGATSATNASTPTSPTDAGSLNAAAGLPPDLQNLVNTLKDFSSAEILIALMLAKAASGDDDDKKSGGGSSAGAGLLAGMAMAGLLGQGNGLQLDLSTQFQNAPQVSSAGNVGLSLNVNV